MVGQVHQQGNGSGTAMASHNLHGHGDPQQAAAVRIRVWRDVFLLAFVLIAVIFVPPARSKSFDLPNSWSAINDANLEQLDAAEAIGSYRLIQAPSPRENLVSGNGTLALCFFRFLRTGKYYLSTVIQNAKSPNNTAAVVWTGNRRDPIQEGGALRWNSTKKSLDLTDVDGNIVWSTGPSNASRIKRQQDRRHCHGAMAPVYGVAASGGALLQRR